MKHFPQASAKSIILNKAIRFVLFVGLVAAMISPDLHQRADAAPVVGTTSAVQGQVFVSTDGASRKAQVRGSIQLNDQVRTKDDSALQILLLDQTVFTVGQNCSMIIDEFVYDPNTTVGELSAQVLTGAFRYMSGQIGKNNPARTTLTTPSASIGIRGTFLEGIVGLDALALAGLGGIDTSNADPEKAGITVLRGSGSRANTLDRRGAISVSSGGVTRRILEPGFFIFSPGPGLPPVGPFPLTDAMREYLDFFLRSEPNGPGENPLDLNSTGSQFSGQDQFENQDIGSNLMTEDELLEAIDDSLLQEEDEDECEYNDEGCGVEGEGEGEYEYEDQNEDDGNGE